MGSVSGTVPNIIHIPSDFIATYDKQWGDELLGDKAHTVIFDNSKIKSIVPGFTASIPFSKGAEEIIKWYDADPSRQKIDEGFNNLTVKIINAYESAFPK
ncbi:MAG: hypothetical protein EHM47_13775 [Ignavibacteriales bacterium]|nr:MAG: hypothetical protein EHM47_13775 [Ignavibacteriales bacterium]